ncbi:MAG TPA: universal stress protein [Candidatus Limnocylindria bacterium]|nr:universal stress protein [Candidatus Limnocylindria bacterium]
MRVLYAYDGSAGSEQARDLLAHLGLPEGSLIEAATVLRPRSTLFELGSVPSDPGEAEAQLIQDLRAELETAARALSGQGRTVETRVLRGRPGQALLAEAELIDADLIVMGSRGHGPIQSVLLGSVSTEVTSHARCSVLVARNALTRRVLLATDGTDTSRPAVEAVASWPMFRTLPVDVVSVSQPVSSWIGLDPGGFGSAYWAELELELADERLEAHREIARSASERLRSVGVQAQDHVATGSAGQEILEAAKQFGADLIVTGSRRSSASFPGVIGSVARSVLHHAGASVLIVREPAAPSTAREAETPEALGVRPAGDPSATDARTAARTSPAGR